MLAVNAPEYEALEDGDKQALIHLVKAAVVLDKINMQLDNPHNLPFKEFLEKECSKGNEQAKLTKILFDAQKGVCALDRESHMIELAKGVKEAINEKGFLGIFMGGLKATAGGIAVAITSGLLASLIFRAKDKA